MIKKATFTCSLIHNESPPQIAPPVWFSRVFLPPCSSWHNPKGICSFPRIELGIFLLFGKCVNNCTAEPLRVSIKTLTSQSPKPADNIMVLMQITTDYSFKAATDLVFGFNSAFFLEWKSSWWAILISWWTNWSSLQEHTPGNLGLKYPPQRIYQQTLQLVHRLIFY